MPADHSLAVDRFRIALKFSLWTWAAYWPGGGLLLLAGGLDIMSLAFTAVALGSFVAILMLGGLRPTSSRTLKQFMLERPIYLVAAVVLLAVASASFSLPAKLGLVGFASLYLGGLVFAAVRLLAVARASGKSLFASRADQMLLLLACVGLFATLVFLDALLEFTNDSLGTPAELVALGSWINLLYPALALLASRPFREPLSWRARFPKPVPAVPGVPAEA